MGYCSIFCEKRGDIAVTVQHSVENVYINIILLQYTLNMIWFLYISNNWKNMYVREVSKDFLKHK